MIEPEDLIYQMGCDGILYFTYDPEENTFYDQCGIHMANIFEVLTPNDIFLFKRDHGYCIFPHRDDPHIWCEILMDE